MNYLKLLRPLNLFIILITQTIFWFGLINPIFQSNSISSWINTTNAILIFFITILLAGAGYIVNDLLDIKTDTVNLKKQSRIINDLGHNNVLFYYFILNGIALAIALYLFLVSGSIVILCVYFLCVVFLFLYSQKLKSTILLGNILVSAFLASVPLFFFFLETDAFQSLHLVNRKAHYDLLILLFGFSIFAFLTNLIREIIKDCEDFIGDKKAHIKTLPTSAGISFSQHLILFISFMLLLVYLFWIYLMEIFTNKFEFLYFTTLIILPTIISALFLMRGQQNSTNFKISSSIFKGIMAMGLLYLCFYI